MKIEIVVPDSLAGEMRCDARKITVFHRMIGEMLRDFLVLNPQTFEYENDFFLATFTETIEPIGYRINISKSPTSESRPEPLGRIELREKGKKW